MKRRIILTILAVIAALACALGLAACSNGGTSGTYYLYENGNFDKSKYIKIDGDKWSDDDNVSGTYKLNGTDIVFYAQMFGSNEEMFSGTLSDGVLNVKILGANITYCKEGSENNVGGGTGNITEPIRKDEFLVTFNLNYINAQDIKKYTEGKFVTFIPDRAGYDFNGWYLDTNLLQLFDTSKPVTSNGLVLYASWVEAITEVGQLHAPIINVDGDVFSWKLVTGASKYRVVATLSGANEYVVDDITTTNYWTFPQNLDAGVYTVKIRAVGDGVTTVSSAYTSRTYSLRVLSAVVGIKFDMATSILTWDKVQNAQEYEIYIGGNLFNKQTENEIDLSNCDAGNLTIKINALKANWLSSSGTANISKKRLKVPDVSLTISDDGKSYILFWTPVVYADTYILKYGDKEIHVKDTTSYTISDTSVIWDGQNTAELTINAYDSKADYLVSSGAKAITLSKIFNLGIESSNAGAGEYSVKGNAWQPVVVSFDLNGASGKLESQTVTTKKGLVYPEIPTRSGYIFRGWFTESACENVYDFTSTVEKSITLYAGWYDISKKTFQELNSGSVTYSSNSSYRYTYFRALSGTKIEIGYNQASSGVTSVTSYMEIYDVTEDKVCGNEQSFSNTAPAITPFYPKMGHVYYIKTYSTSNTKIDLSFTTYPSNTYLPDDGGTAKANYMLADFSNNANNYVPYDSEYTLTTEVNVGYTWLGWYNGDTQLTKELSYTFTMPAENVTYTAKFSMLEEMRNFKFVSTATTCTIEGLKDKTVTEIIIPEYVTTIYKPAFKDCSGVTIYCEAKSKPSGWSDGWNWGCPVVWNCKNNDIATDGNIYTVIDGVRYALKDNIATVVKQSTLINGDVEILSKIKHKNIEYSVTTIRSNVFKNCSGLTSIIIPDSVTTISYDSFNGCSGVTIYCEAESKPSGWNGGWNNGNFIVWDSKNNEIATDGYIYTVIAGVRYGIKDNVATAINQSAEIKGDVEIFSKVKYKNIEYSVTSISYNAFKDCSGLKSITIPDSVITIGEYAFIRCSELTSITIGDGVTSIDEGAFNYCSALTSITVDSNNKNYKSVDNCILTKDGKTLVVGCNNSIIPNSVTDIGNWAFSGRNELTSIKIPAGVTNIGNYAFSGCGKLFDITVDSNNKYYKSISNCILTKDGKTLILSCNSSVIPNSVIRIESYAFYDCSGLTSITIPNSVTSIGYHAFMFWNGATIYCEAKSKPTGWSDGWYLGCSVVWDCKNNDVATDGYIYTIINGVRYALKNNVAKVVRQSTVINGDIEILSKIKYKNIEYSVTFIEDAAFESCRELTSIIIPDSVTLIEDAAFKDCTGLKTITIHSCSMVGSPFSGCGAIENLICHMNLISVIPKSSLKTVIITDGYISEFAFEDCSALTSIIIRDGVTSVGDYAFYGCSGLTIYCEAESKPSGWASNWNFSDCPVVWGYKPEN